MKKVISVLLALVTLMSVTGTVLASPGNGAGGVTGPAFYVDGVLYRTVGTPTDLSNTGAPTHSFDVIYAVGGGQADVATAAPGDTDYNGGRWQVHALAYNTDYATTLAAHDLDGDGVLDSEAEINSALGDAGPAGATDTGIVVSFVCPVIRVAPGH
ncbi:MAG: hypothetical protein V3S98_00140 [Dehalococcoidia bacterium]